MDRAGTGVISIISLPSDDGHASTTMKGILGIEVVKNAWPDDPDPLPLACIDLQVLCLQQCFESGSGRGNLQWKIYTAPESENGRPRVV